MLASQYYLLTFLPLSHPQTYLPMLLRVWDSVNSYMFDDRMLQFFSRLVEIHVNPTVSDPQKIRSVPDDARSDDEARPEWESDDISSPGGSWGGIYKDVGIFSDHDWNFLMSKCLASMGELRLLFIIIIIITRSSLTFGATRNPFSRLGLSSHRLLCRQSGHL
jgi:proteasome activator subunit 4